MENAQDSHSAAYTAGLSVALLRTVFRGKHMSAAIIVVTGGVLLLSGSLMNLYHYNAGWFVQFVGAGVGGIGLTGWIFSSQHDS